jgi:hypothetical protein
MDTFVASAAPHRSIAVDIDCLVAKRNVRWAMLS